MFIEKNDGCSHMTCTRCSHQFCWDCLSRWSSGCSSPRPIHSLNKLLNEDIWGDSVSTRCLTKSVGVPIICSLGGAAVGVAVGVGSVVVAGAILISPIAGAVYVYHHPPRIMRKYYPAIPIPETDQGRILQQGVIITLPWTETDPVYLSAFQGGQIADHDHSHQSMSPTPTSPPTFFGINGRMTSGGIFIGYLSRSTFPASPTSSCVIYCIPRECPASDVLDIGIDPVRYDAMLQVMFPSFGEGAAEETNRERDDRVRGELIAAIERELVNFPVDL
jgi:hypothetical protein